MTYLPQLAKLLVPILDTIVTFLSDRELRPADLPKREGLKSVGLYVGKGGRALEVALYQAQVRPAKQTVRDIWKERFGGRNVPLVVVVIYGDEAGLCGHAEVDQDPPPCLLDLEVGHVERLCATALDLPDHHAVDRFLREQLPDAESPIFGIRNQGLLATYVVQRGRTEIDTIDRSLWEKSLTQSKSVRQSAGIGADRHRKALSALGFSLQQTPGQATILTSKGSKVALAIFLDADESAEIATKRFGSQSPISYAINQAQSEKLDWVIVAKDAELRLYPTQTGVGVGRRGLTDTYLQINLDLVPEDRLPLLWLAFSADALAESGTLKALLENSNRYATDIGIRLRNRIYDSVIPQLSMAIVKARNLKKPTTDDLRLTYEMSMLVLFRLLFIAYAEDHDLLPYRTNEQYKDRSLTKTARELKNFIQQKGTFSEGTSRWDEMKGLWKAIRESNSEWGVPAYDGGLFEEKDQDTHRAGHELSKIELSNRDFGLILANLLLDDKTPEGLGPVDFRSLGVREFGTVYEGLLENELSVADSHLTTDKKGDYEPTERAETATVQKGQTYLHTRSGARKSSGSYYTKSFAVDHLLEHSLEPVLNDHLKRLEKLAESDPTRAGKELFEFYVADIAMGSGHFLISAIDRIEKRFLAFLGNHPLPGVEAELEKMREAARKKLGKTLGEHSLENNKLLRRLIARRCIYGVDLNPLAVELARLSVWIHTFVPGLPLSFLDHNLVCGNSLVGIATFDEALEALTSKGHTLDLFEDHAKKLLGIAADTIREFREISDSDLADIERAKKAQARIDKALAGTRALFDIIAVARFDEDVDKGFRKGIAGHMLDLDSLDTLNGTALHEKARRVSAAISPFHFPTVFPEIFLERQYPGFDVILGNPPWEKVQVEENEFWGRHFPGFRGYSQHEQEALRRQYRRGRPDLVLALKREAEKAETLRNVLMSGPFPELGRGHPDLYKAFGWRIWYLTRLKYGSIGVVLPRSIWNARGSSEFRKQVLQNGGPIRLTNLSNKGGWVFDDAEHRYTITLSVIRKSASSDGERTVCLSGPFTSLTAFTDGITVRPTAIRNDEVLSWTDTSSMPLLPGDTSGEVFAIMRNAPRLDNQAGPWRCRPIQGDLNSTTGKPLMRMARTAPESFWPVYKGESFDIWQADTGPSHYYAWIDPRTAVRELQSRRLRAAAISRTAFSEFTDDWVESPDTLPCLQPRIAYRRVTNRTNRRTLIVCLVPARVVLTDKASYLAWPRGDASDQSYLLGLLSSLPVDWYIRCVAELQIDFHILNPLPIPTPSRTDKFWKRAVELAGRLACPDKRFAEWAKQVGVKCGPLKEEEKDDMIHELDAVVAHLYGLSEKQLMHIFETFHEGWDYEERMRATLGHFASWTKKKSR